MPKYVVQSLVKDRKNPRWLRLYDVQQVLKNEIGFWDDIRRSTPKGVEVPPRPDLFHAIRVMRAPRESLWLQAYAAHAVSRASSPNLLHQILDHPKQRA